MLDFRQNFSFEILELKTKLLWGNKKNRRVAYFSHFLHILSLFFHLKIDCS